MEDRDVYQQRVGIPMEQLITSGIDADFLEMLVEHYDFKAGDFSADFIALYNRPVLLRALSELVETQSSQIASRERLYKRAEKQAQSARNECCRLRCVIADAFLKGQKKATKDLSAEIRRLRCVIFDAWLASLNGNT